MNKQEFQDIVNDVIGTVKTGRGKKAVYSNKEALEVRWLSGGQTGGNCWDTGESHHYPVDAEPEEEFWELDNILERVSPGITYLQYRKLEKLIEVDSETVNEYYENYCIYSIKRLSVEKLWKFLVEHDYGEADTKAKRRRARKDAQGGPYGFD